jgi:dissimilatory sulfite reductase (desulfoviridin) alpha/beta subunit
MENIDYEVLRKQGFLKQKQEAYFVLRTRMPGGVYKKEHLEKIANIASKYAKGYVHLSVRQAIEIPFIKYENIAVIQKELKEGAIKTGTAGPRFRPIVSCPGNNWCRFGLIDTFRLANRIEQELNLVCGMELPYKFKMAISGCPNSCTRVEVSDIGIHGQVVQSDSGASFGYAVYLAGCGGRRPCIGFKLDKILTEDEVFAVIDAVIKFYQRHARPKQRLNLLIDEFGKDNFLKEVLKKT